MHLVMILLSLSFKLSYLLMALGSVAEWLCCKIAILYFYMPAYFLVLASTLLVVIF